MGRKAAIGFLKAKTPPIAMFLIAMALIPMTLCACVFRYGPGAPGEEAGIAGASRTSGVAPLCVQFVTDCSVSEAARESFHELDYSWDFDDPESGTWGTTGRSKNAAKGPVAAHVFEKPGTYEVTRTVRSGNGVLGMDTLIIAVEDPDRVYAGEATICVSDATSADFSGAPEGSLEISTDDLASVAPYAQAGRRILLRRGSSWTISGDPPWPANYGPVTIGAYGTGRDPDASGLYANAPVVDVAGGSFLPLDGKKDWRIMDLRLVDPSQSNGSVGGAMDLGRDLLLRIDFQGFLVGLGWSHWVDPQGEQIADMAVVSCRASGAAMNVAYVGSERLALLGNAFSNARDSHVLRVWQAYQSVIGENLLSGSSLESDSGRHALKLHGPKEEELASAEWNHLSRRSEFIVVSGNVFGSSGPWPVVIGPQDAFSDERLSDIVFERNDYRLEYGARSSLSLDLDTALRAMASRLSVRNNVIDASGYGSYFTGVSVVNQGIAPLPSGVWIYNNNIYKRGSPEAEGWTGVNVDSGISGGIVKNNLVSFPGGTRLAASVRIAGAPIDDQTVQGIEVGANLLSDSPGFIDPDDAEPLGRDFRLDSGSQAVDAGSPVPLLEDHDGNRRSVGKVDIGAFER